MADNPFPIGSSLNRRPILIQAVADTIIKTMFAPHELPLDKKLDEKYREAAKAAIETYEQWR